MKCRSQALLPSYTQHYMQVYNHVLSNGVRKGYPCFIQVSGRGYPCFIEWISRVAPISSKGVVWDTPVCSPACATTQNSEKYVSNTQVLPSVDKTAGPTVHRNRLTS